MDTYNNHSFVFIILVGIVTLIHHVDSERILLIPHLHGSHLSQVTAIGQELLQRNHEVYCILPKNSRFTEAVHNKGIKLLMIDVATTEGLVESDKNIDQVNRFVFEEDIPFYDLVTHVTTPALKHCDVMLHDTKLINDIKELNFDIAVVDLHPVAPFLALLPYTLDIPFIGMSTSLMNWDMGVPYLPSFMPFLLHETTDRMTFLQKLQSLLAMLFFNSPLSFFEASHTLLNEFTHLSSWQHLIKQARLFIVPRDHILDYPMPTMPHVVRTPGIVYGPAKPLPLEFTNQMKTFNNIVIVSFGSTADAMPNRYIHLFINTFTRFSDYLFIWKLPTGDKYVLPKNVITYSWLPQNDLMGHNKTRLFITHCGSNGLHEALYHGVPILGFPLAVDQFHNANNVQKRGYGMRLNLKTFTLEEFAQSMTDVLNNELIEKKLKHISQILKDRQLPKKEIAHSIEHFMKYGDAHLRPASIDMPFYELYLLDIFAFLNCISIGTVVLLYVVCTKFICKISRRFSKEEKDKSE